MQELKLIWRDNEGTIRVTVYNNVNVIDFTDIDENYPNKKIVVFHFTDNNGEKNTATYFLDEILQIQY